MALITSTDGFTVAEVVTHIINYIGNVDSEFEDFVEESLNPAYFRYCKAHDWSFLQKQGVSLIISALDADKIYTLPTGSGYFMEAPNVETIYDEDEDTVLRKVELSQIRRFDAADDDGASTDDPSIWAPISDTEIRLWPPEFEVPKTLKMDGRVTPTPLSSGSTLLIPYKFQEGFLEYLKAIALDRENDDRAAAKKQEALFLIKQDIQEDMRQRGNTETPRIKSMREASVDGWGGNLDAWLFWADDNCGY